MPDWMQGWERITCCLCAEKEANNSGKEILKQPVLGLLLLLELLGVLLPLEWQQASSEKKGKRKACAHAKAMITRAAYRGNGGCVRVLGVLLPLSSLPSGPFFLSLAFRLKCF